MNTSIPILDLSGTPYERGLKHGTVMQDSIDKVVNKTLRFIETTHQQQPKGPSLQVILNRVTSYKEHLQNDWPDLWEEIQGISTASRIDTDRLLLINYLLEFTDLFADMPIEGISPGCTAIAATRPATLGEHIYVAQNYDLIPSFQDHILLLKVEDKNKPKSVVFTITGLIGLAGLNELGLGVCINNLVASDYRAGVPYPFVLRRALQSSSLAEALEHILNTPRATGLNYLLGFSDGEICDAETTATTHALDLGFNGLIIHTNHYLSRHLNRMQVPRPTDLNSLTRYTETQNRLIKYWGRIDSEIIMDALSDHTGAPESVCAHVDKESDIGRRTLCSMIFDLNSRTATFYPGNPCISGNIKINICEQ
jgi:isopenicillin-N N-acyltransferase-like protein